MANHFNSTSEDLLYQILLALNGGGGGLGGVPHGGTVTAAYPVAKSVIPVETTTNTNPLLGSYFPATSCNVLDIVNHSGADIVYYRTGYGVAITIPNGESRAVTGITNANQIFVQRLGDTTAPVKVTAEAITF